jgi:tRNA(Ile)-lysidine synthase
VYEKVAKTIRRYELLASEPVVILGFSGGADSLCLLDCLTTLGYNIIVAHLDHQLRPESSTEVALVRAMCAAYGVPFMSEAVDVAERAKLGGSLEEEGRLARYQYLARVAQENDAQCVAVGHTADDQVETVLMHFLRGSGPAGLRGMLPKTRFSDWLGIEASRTIDLIRPLYELTRMDTIAHCKKVGLKPLDDPSNVDPKFYRNRIRHELLPQLESYNPGIKHVILRLSEIMRDQVDFNLNHLEVVWPLVISEAGPCAYLIDVIVFRQLHPSLQRELFRKAISDLAPALREISFETTCRAVERLQDLSKTNPMALPGGFSLESCGEKVLLRKPGAQIALPGYPQLIASTELELTCPGEVSLESGWRINARLASNHAEARALWFADNQHRIAVLAAGMVSDGLRLRVRQPGDRIQLPNVAGRTKIGDLMTNRKIPRQVRRRWPLVLVKDVVLWVPGIQRSDQAQQGAGPPDVAILQLHPPDEVSHVETTV